MKPTYYATKTLARKTFGVSYSELREARWDELTDRARIALQQRRSELEALGLRFECCLSPATIGSLRTVQMLMLARDGTSYVSVQHDTHDVDGVVTELVSSAVTSELSNGETMITCDRRDLYPAEFSVEYNKRKSVTDLVDWHQQRLRNSMAQPVTYQSGFDLQERASRVAQVVSDYLVQRGVMVPLSAEEVERMQFNATTDVVWPATPYVAAATPAQVVGEDGVYLASHVIEAEAWLGKSRHPEIVAELDKIQNKQGGWLNGAIVLGISIVFFVGLGAARWDWTFVGLLIPVLLFHESGHLVAMRLFKYRNLKMFFIPLFGAAVTGQNYNVAGWKKAIVSLAGPVPGIFLGCVLGVAAMAIGDQSLLMQAAILMIIMNAFNLLPFLPLDGGWVIHTLLFSRHPVLDVLFRSFAAMAMISAGLLGMWMFTVIGVFMLISMRASYQIAKIAADLRELSSIALSPDGQTIPVEAADTIIDRLTVAFPQPLPPKLKAQQTLQVFEAVNARPPGVLATLALIGLQGVSFVAAIIFTAVLMFAQQQDLAPPPKQEEPIEQHGADEAGDEESEQGEKDSVDTHVQRHFEMAILRGQLPLFVSEDHQA